VFKYLNKKLNNPERPTRNKKARVVTNSDRHNKKREEAPTISPTIVTPKVSYRHLTHLAHKNDNSKNKATQPSSSLPGVYTKFNPEPLDFEMDSSAGRRSSHVASESYPKAKQMDVVDYGTYSDPKTDPKSTPWPLPVGLDDAVDNYLEDEANQKSTGMYLPEETLKSLKQKVFKHRQQDDEETKVKFDNSEEISKDNLDTGEDSPMYPVPVVVRGKNKATGNPLSLSNLPRGYYVLMPLKKTKRMPGKIPVLPKVSIQ
jgi:hypothetical protein